MENLSDNEKWYSKKIIELRKKILVDYIKLLGYSSISDIRNGVEPTGEYATLSKVGEKLENYKTLAFVQKDNDNPSVDAYKIKILEMMKHETESADRAIDNYYKMVEDSAEELQEDMEFFGNKDENLRRARSLFPDYFKTMKSQLSEDDWEKYTIETRKVARLILELNYDLLPKEEQKGLSNFTNLTQLEVEDKISKVIDSPSFNAATNIESVYAEKETQSFTENLDKFSESSERFQQGELAKSLKELKDEALETRKEKQDKISKYEELKKVYEKATKIIIKGPTDYKEK